MRLVYLIGILAFVGSSAAAEPAQVQSGEHGAFTRLVTTLPSAGAGWSVTQTGREVTLRLEEHAAGFDTATVFDLITRARITALSPEASTLTLRLACDCRVATFVERDRFVVMDVAEAATALEGAVVSLNEAPALQTADAAPQTTGPLGRAPLSDSEREILERVQAEVSEGIGRAASRGLLQPAANLELRPRRRPQVDTSFVPPSPAEDAEPPNPLANLRLSTSMDLPNGFDIALPPHSDSGLACLADDIADLSLRKSDAPFHEQIAEARSTLYDARDRLVPGAARKLAMRYLYHGFGAEARQALMLLKTRDGGDEALLEMAALLDGRVPAQNGRLAGMQGCDGAVALWSAVALAELDPLRGYDPRPALKALGALPLHLRQVLAPMMADRLRRYGDRPAAEKALSTLRRQPAPLSQTAQLAQARLDLDQGRAEQGEKQLSDLAEGGGEEAPRALIRLIEEKTRADRPIAPEQAELAAAYAYENRGTALGDQLTLAEIKAHLQASAFDTAFARLADLTPQDALPLWPLAVTRLTDRGEDIAFLEVALNLTPLQRDGLDRPARLALANRLVSFGFGEAAQGVLADIPDSPLDAERQILSARAALALNQPFRARAELIGVEGQEADALRAEASEVAGAFADAQALYRQSGQSEDEARSAWLAQDFESDALAANPVFGPVAAASQNRPEVGSGLAGMLTRSTALLEESSASRAALEALLDAPELDLDPAQ